MFEQTLEPRSAYILAGSSRSAWQHQIPQTKALRYSITFRTLKAGWPDRPHATHDNRSGSAKT